MSGQINVLPSNLLDTEQQISITLSLLADETNQQKLLDQLLAWNPGEVAALIEGLTPTQRVQLWSIFPESYQAELLSWLPEQVISNLLRNMDEEAVLAATSSMETADLVDVFEAASDELSEVILESMNAEDRNQLEKQLAFDDESAGRLMRTDWVAIRADVQLDTVIRYLRMRGSMPAHTDGLLVVDREGKYEGKLPVESLLTQPPETDVKAVMVEEVDFVYSGTDISEVTRMFEKRELSSLAVVDENNMLIGRITLDDVLPLIRAEAESPMMQMAGLKEDEDLFAPIWPSAFRRMFWLMINLATAFLASWVIGRFEATLQQIVALAVLMPIVASMGGIAGSQTLTLAIRGLALGQISDENTRWLAIKEVSIAAINGVVWAVVVGIMSWLWFGQTGIALVLGTAMMINLLAAAVAGVLIPLVLERSGLDPALSGSVILTTVTDVVGFISFLGLATWVLLP